MLQLPIRTLQLSLRARALAQRALAQRASRRRHRWQVVGGRRAWRQDHPNVSPSSVGCSNTCGPQGCAPGASPRSPVGAAAAELANRLAAGWGPCRRPPGGLRGDQGWAEAFARTSRRHEARKSASCPPAGFDTVRIAIQPRSGDATNARRRYRGAIALLGLADATKPPPRRPRANAAVLAPRRH